MSWRDQMRRANVLDGEIEAATNDLLAHTGRLRAAMSRPGVNIGAGLLLGFAIARLPAVRMMAVARLGRRSYDALMRNYRKP